MHHIQTIEQHAADRYRALEQQEWLLERAANCGQPGSLFALITVRYGIAQCHAQLAWAKEALNTLKQRTEAVLRDLVERRLPTSWA